MAIEECVSNNILKDVLIKFSKEVAAMAWFEFDEEEYERAIIKEREAAVAKAVEKAVAEVTADKNAVIAGKDIIIAGKDAEIQRLKALLVSK